MEVPERARQLFTRTKARCAQRRRLGDAGPYICRLSFVPLDPTEPQQKDITLTELGSLSGQTLENLRWLDRIGIRTIDGPTDAGSPATEIGQYRAAGDPTLRPMIDAVIVVIDAAEVSGTGQRIVSECGVIADVSEPVPLTARLRVPCMQHVVVARSGGTTRHLVSKGLPTEQRRIGQAHAPVESEDATFTHQPRSVDDSFGSEEIQASEQWAVGLVPYVPTGR